ncbi:MAG: DUF2007 domain-containing protein [Phaeodactylibacter sp.]|nr:DUF2007 domain-containing protein [Phaeodactylibacter sp.]MCB9301337.1 DUF2007 domain-containing protein [Lewinellaceae bacterium]HQU60616.1 DUF2007 domain-containing protein [Saprospiraceae bacterium]
MKEDWVMIYASTEYFKAKIVEDILKQNGIESHILEKGDSAIPSVGEVTLYAPRDKAAQAIEILKKAELIEVEE